MSVSIKQVQNVRCIRNCRHALGELEGSRQMLLITLLHMKQRAQGGRPTFWKYDVISNIRLCQLTRIYLMNNPSKIHSDAIWNEKASSAFEEGYPTRRTRRVAIWDNPI